MAEDLNGLIDDYADMTTHGKPEPGDTLLLNSKLFRADDRRLTRAALQWYADRLFAISWSEDQELAAEEEALAKRLGVLSA